MGYSHEITSIPCPTCSCFTNEDGELSIQDKEKWVRAPDPCPKCHRRFMKSLEEFGTEQAMRVTVLLLKQITQGDNNG